MIFVGPAGSGKTVCYETLSRVLNMLHFSKPTEERITSPMKGPRIEVGKCNLGGPSLEHLHRALLFSKHDVKANDAIPVNRRDIGFIGIYHRNVPRDFEMWVALL